MGLQKQLLSFLIVLVSSTPFRTNGLRDDVDYLLLQQESGVDFRNYPSYLNPELEGSSVYMLDNTSMGNKIGSSKKFNRRRLSASVETINVLNFGAKGDGKSDDTNAFLKAWKEACSSSGDVSIMVPKGKTFHVTQMSFLGPCKSDITMEIAGSITASGNRADYTRRDGRQWIIFESVNDLVVKGGGTIDGHGSIWWQNSCKKDKSKKCKGAPTAITFYKCKNLVVKDLKVKNAQQIHLSFEKCENVQASKLVVSSPGDSPNTDGIHITGTQNIHVASCTIGTGDDCISIESGSKTVKATDITCGPGHGISIGSLGDHNSEEYVSDVHVSGAKLSGTTNGLRIKTWQGGSGSASNIKFENVEMKNVQFPIIIDQEYCDLAEPCKQQGSAVQVKDVVYKNIKGTSATKVAIQFKCSKSHPCQGILLENVNLVGADGKKSQANCENVKLQNSGTVSPGCP